LTEDHII